MIFNLLITGTFILNSVDMAAFFCAENSTTSINITAKLAEKLEIYFCTSKNNGFKGEVMSVLEMYTLGTAYQR